MFLRKISHLENFKIEELHVNQECIPFNFYEHLYDAIVQGDVNTVRNEFENEDFKISVNMPFDYEDQDICRMFGKESDR